ncbi:MAG: DNA alkylation repair protein [Clostridia bacterium]
MSSFEEKVQNQLFELQDLKYRDFHCKLMPTVNPEAVIGVRTPELRKLAKEFSKTPESAEFLKILPHKYYEENNLHGFLIEIIKDYDQVIKAVDAFLPYVDNWATCDLMSPKAFKKHLPELFEKIKEWMKSDHTYTIRFGIEMLMSFYLDEQFEPEFLELVAFVKSDEYYVKMMIAWYFATALAKQYDSTLPFIDQYRLDKWTHNKSIQKAIESYRITDKQKIYLRALKIK